jgi:hypothetical protein
VTVKPSTIHECAEAKRLVEDETRLRNWKRWGPYLAERQWGTVREDYSPHNSSWDYFTHDQARSRTYRWGEDGLMGFTDRQCRLCMAVALWNGKDPILKERLFGVSGTEGNHGEDVKEYYFYLASSPTHSYVKSRYKYPHAAFPYDEIVRQAQGHIEDPERELVDTGVFNQGGYFDVDVEYAKGGPDDILMKITIVNRGEAQSISVLPTLWYRNTWGWGRKGEGYTSRPLLKRVPGKPSVAVIHEELGAMTFTLDGAESDYQLLFTENESNHERLFGEPSPTHYVKDAFHRYVVDGEKGAVNPKEDGTKAAFLLTFAMAANETRVVNVRLKSQSCCPIEDFGGAFDQVFTSRVHEYHEYMGHLIGEMHGNPDAQRISEQAYAGLLQTKQFYYYSVKEWIEGDPSQPAPPGGERGRNRDWPHLYNRDIISMPDKWEYPWYAAWDLAFHMLPMARVDGNFAKDQLLLLLREWYMHPNGQIPAYEFNFSDVNPPVHAWACWRVYKMTADQGGERDLLFLRRTFQKLLLNFTWWVNRKDKGGNNLFSGGFLGMDNIGLFNRSHMANLPVEDAHLEQADGTAWMAFFCGTMLSIAFELAKYDKSYGDLAYKFFEHFIAITDAINTVGGSGLWDEHDGFYYDQLHADGKVIPLRTRSLVGLIPLFAVEVIDDAALEGLPEFKKRKQWFIENRPDLAEHISFFQPQDGKGSARSLLSVVSLPKLKRILSVLLDEEEFLSDYGIRSLSKVHLHSPYALVLNGERFVINYVPGETTTTFFGANSNWRGPVWFPTNYLLIEALERYHHFYGDDLKVECPARSGNYLTLKEVALEISRRLVRLFLADEEGMRAYMGEEKLFTSDDSWKESMLYHEYFHGDSGKGLGAIHQTGWTALIANCLDKLTKAGMHERLHEQIKPGMCS